MTTATVLKNLSMAAAGSVFVSLAGIGEAQAITMAPSYSEFYTITDLGSVPELPPTYAGMTFLPGEPNTLLIGGSANTQDAGIYAVPVIRDSENHIIGFGDASLYAAAPGIGTGGVDAGIAYSPTNDVLFYTSYDDNSIGQIKVGSTGPDKQTDLGTIGIPSSTGSLTFVPEGFPGAGQLKFTSYTANIFYSTTITPDGSGTYDIAAPSQSIELSGGLDSLAYVEAGNPGFSEDSLLILEYDAGSIAAYAIDENGNPIPHTRQDFVTDQTNMIGSTVDPVTGDLLVSTQNFVDATLNKIFKIMGFNQPKPASQPTTPNHQGGYCPF